MRKTNLAAPVCLLLLLAAHALSAAEFWTDDPRLSQKITCKLRHKTVASILYCLQKQTGVTLKPGYNKDDWQVRDRKMDLFVRDLELGELMQSIARVMKFKWDRSGEEGKWRYRLFMDRKTLLDAEGQSYRREEEFKKKQAERRTALLDKLAGLSNPSPQDLAKLKEGSPFLTCWRRQEWEMRSASSSRRSPPRARRSWTGRNSSMSPERLCSSGQEAALRFLQAMDRLHCPIFGESQPARGHQQGPAHQPEPQPRVLALVRRILRRFLHQALHARRDSG